MTIFPDILKGPLSESIIKKAREKKLIEINIINIRDFAEDKHKMVDDRPYGGGPGMVMKPEPIFKAVESCKQDGSLILLMTPSGKQLTQKLAKEYAEKYNHFVLICGHYEGIDHRVELGLNPEKVSIGPYILTNGAIAASVFIDVLARLKPGVLGNESSLEEETHSELGLAEYPQYTRPKVFRGMSVPDVLLSGNHNEIRKWREKNRKKIMEEKNGCY